MIQIKKGRKRIWQNTEKFHANIILLLASVQKAGRRFIKHTASTATNMNREQK